METGPRECSTVTTKSVLGLVVEYWKLLDHPAVTLHNCCFISEREKVRLRFRGEKEQVLTIYVEDDESRLLLPLNLL